MATKTKVSRQVQLQKLLEGIAKRYPGVIQLTFGGATFAIVDLEKLIQQDIDGMAASAKAKADYSQVVQQERTTRAKVSPVIRQFKNYVLATFGDTQDAVSVLADFGLTPRTRKKPSAATVVEAQGKAEATRKARGTVGPKKKEQIKGQPATSPASTGTTPPKA
jgi:hypothetical protein